MKQIGTDGGFLNKPAPLELLTLGNGERADVIIDFYGFEGQSLILNNNASTPFPGGIKCVLLLSLFFLIIHTFTIPFIYGDRRCRHSFARDHQV